MNSSNPNPTVSSARNRCLIWGFITAVGLALAGLTARQLYFNTATAETSYDSASDIWDDPRYPCVPIQDGWQCRQNPDVSPTATMRFYAGQCSGPGSSIQSVILDLPVEQLTRIDPQVKGAGPGSILVTYRPRVFGLFGNNHVLKVKATPPGHSPCGTAGY